MKTQSLTAAKKAFKLFSHAGADKATIRYNVMKFLEAMQYLGEKHILAKQVQRKN